MRRDFAWAVQRPSAQHRRRWLTAALVILYFTVLAVAFAAIVWWG